MYSSLHYNLYFAKKVSTDVEDLEPVITPVVSIVFGHLARLRYHTQPMSLNEWQNSGSFLQIILDHP